MHVDRASFTDEEYTAFGERLHVCLEVLGELLDDPSFGVGPMTIGAELELFLCNRDGRPVPRNQEVRELARHAQVNLELDRFNLEINCAPRRLAGRPFTALREELTSALDVLGRAAAAHDAETTLIGILPTLRSDDLPEGILSDEPRYLALSNGLSRLRREPFEIHINGHDHLAVSSHDVRLEGANSSWQSHLRVPPDDFADAYNAAQLAAAASLAVSGNSPFFLGARLWDETRIALFKQSVDDRAGHRATKLPRVSFGTGWVDDGPGELFAEAVDQHEPLIPVLSDEQPRKRLGDGELPSLDELRLHQGTVWRWNRAIYDPGHGGHLRIEMRALPSGPTVIDNVASMAFQIGLTLALVPMARAVTATMPFAVARDDFYQAAQHGRAATLHWWGSAGRLEEVPAATLVERCLPLASDALVDAGVERAEADDLIGIVADRLAGGTGADWQRTALEALEPRLGRYGALHDLFRAYQERSSTGQPVSRWEPVA